MVYFVLPFRKSPVLKGDHTSFIYSQSPQHNAPYLVGVQLWLIKWNLAPQEMTLWTSADCSSQGRQEAQSAETAGL